MKVTLERTVTETFEIEVEFPFFRREDNVTYAIYSLTHGVKIIRDNFFNTWQVSTMSNYEIKDKILNDEHNLEFTHSEISEKKFNEIKTKFLNCL